MTTAETRHYAVLTALVTYNLVAWLRTKPAEERETLCDQQLARIRRWVLDWDKEPYA